jgi:phospholipid/cholesterol/gamma-HCH transport system substrate-binding protein
VALAVRIEVPLMHRPRANPFVSGVVAAVVLTVVMIAVIVSGIPAGPQIPLPWNHLVTLHVQLADADALAPHASVEVAGVKVGEVESVEAQGNLALATLQINSRYSDIHRDATVALRAHGLFGPKYISILPGTSVAPQLRDGDTINVNQTVQPVDLNSILQDVQSPEQQNLRTTIIEFGKASAGRGDDVNHLLAAAASLTQVLDSPTKAVDAVSPQLGDTVVKDESFNAYFAQTPLDQLVANSEQTIQAFAANADHLQSLLVHADSSLGTLDSALGGQSGNLATVIQTLGDPKHGTLVRLTNFTYLLGLFGANLTGKDTSDTNAIDVTSGIIGAIENVKSAFAYADSCPTKPVPGATQDNHCGASPDGTQHYLHVRTFNFPPGGIPAPPQQCFDSHLPPPFPPKICLGSLQASADSPRLAGAELNGFGDLLAS